MSRRIAIVGSRTIANLEDTDTDMTKALMERDWVYYNIDSLIGLWSITSLDHQVAILSGGAVGVDRRAQEYAIANDIPFFLFKPYHLIDNKVEYNPRYFFTRNKQIVDNCDELIAFWDGESNGTGDTIRYARKRKKVINTVYYDEKAILEFID